MLVHLLSYIAMPILDFEGCIYLNPSFRYPAAFLYHSLSGIIHLFSHGRLMMKLVSDGCDIVAAVGGGCRVEWLPSLNGLLSKTAPAKARQARTSVGKSRRRRLGIVVGKKRRSRELKVLVLGALCCCQLHYTDSPNLLSSQLPSHTIDRRYLLWSSLPRTIDCEWRRSIRKPHKAGPAGRGRQQERDKSVAA